MMKTLLVLNPKAANGVVERSSRRYERMVRDIYGELTVARTTEGGHATTLVRSALSQGAERVVVVGGDGTLNEAVNGFFAPEGDPLSTEAELVYVPAGTGGDFSRSIGLSKVEFATMVDRMSPRLIDLGVAELVDARGAPLHRAFINISSFGSSGVIVDKVNTTSKRLGGRVSFMLGTVKGLLAYKNQRILLKIDDDFEEEMLINTVAVANGRYFGGGMKIAPHALVDDGWLHVIVVGDLGLGQFIRNSSKLYQGTHLELPQVRELRGKNVQATPLGDEPVLIDLDGEQPGRLPVRYSILPRALRLVAPWERGEAAAP